MAAKTIKRRAKNAAGGRKGVQKPKSAPRTAVATSPPGTPPSPGSSLPAVIPPAPAVTEPGQRKQKWTDLPEDSRIREKVAAMTAMKIQGFSNEEIAEKLGLSVRSLRQYRWIAAKNGWLTTADPHDVAEYEITHGVVQGLKELVAYRDKETGLPRQEVILRSAEGLGIFKDHSKVDAPVAQQANVLTINVLMPEGANQTIRPGTTGGTAAYAEGEVVSVIDAEPGRLPMQAGQVPEV